AAESGLEQAAKIGGCGCCTGFGITCVGGTLKNLPENSKTSLDHIRGIISSASSHCACSSAGLVSNASCSTSDDDLPVPQLTRPPERMSRVAIRSAIRSGWLYRQGRSVTPWPSRIRLVRAATKLRKTSGADECEYS